MNYAPAMGLCATQGASVYLDYLRGEKALQSLCRCVVVVNHPVTVNLWKSVKSVDQYSSGFICCRCERLPHISGELTISLPIFRGLSSFNANWPAEAVSFPEASRLTARPAFGFVCHAAA